MRKAVMILIAAILLCGWNVNADSMAGEETYEIVTVQGNDTLWDIAAKKVDDRMDVRKYIYEVQQLNHLGDACILTPGSKLKLLAVTLTGKRCPIGPERYTFSPTSSSSDPGICFCSMVRMLSGSGMP